MRTPPNASKIYSSTREDERQANCSSWEMCTVHLKYHCADLIVELGLGSCRVGPRLLDTVGTLCLVVLARQVYYQAQARPTARLRAVLAQAQPSEYLQFNLYASM